MKLSILDQALVVSGNSHKQALQEALCLAQWGEKLGYTRYWLAEHHDIAGYSCPAPEVMLGYIGAHTETIRLGSGAVLLPHYKPFKIAETFNLLATLFPNRIDVGIGRAPGGSAEVTMALSDNFLENVRKMPESIKELLYFLNHNYPADHMISKIKASPLPDIPPQLWLLGTSEKSAKMAAENGTAYAFGQFMSTKNGKDIIKNYVENFKGNSSLNQPKTILAVSAICAETEDKAEQLARNTYLWYIQSSKGEITQGIPTLEAALQYSYTPAEQEMIDKMRNNMIIGDPIRVRDKLLELQKIYEVDELMIITITHSFEDRKRSYELIAKECLF
ncbi:LLM class flavin-dependent oxidoreductase [Bacillus sp. Marseille-P3661]|uniref:LLM class flavin-dependent oxidoreductase n=1 Tax=Bacillus sp. Marseille-P3661 TaxID=1936234 RepID=UPI000C854ACC|nr:LLM class flavin-dependent oxidoreductase [Bacillus sp. Marseille-P3661]